MATTAYRDPLERTRIRFEELVEALVRTLPAARARERIVVRRLARAAFGAVGIAGALVLVVSASWGSVVHKSSDPSLSAILVGSWVAALVAYGLVRLCGLGIAEPKPPAPTGRLVQDVAAFTAAHETRRDGRLFASLSAVLPAIAISLLAPLTIHLVFWSVALRRENEAIREFDGWIGVSLALVGHAHLILAFLAARHAHGVPTRPVESVRRDDGLGVGELGGAVLAGVIPGILFFAVPPVLVAVTGVVFVPCLWVATRRIALSERSALAAAGLEQV